MYLAQHVVRLPPLILAEDLVDPLAQRVTILISLQTSSLFLVRPTFFAAGAFQKVFRNLRKKRSLFTVTLCFNHLRRVSSRTSGSALKSVRNRLLAHAAPFQCRSVLVDTAP